MKTSKFTPYRTDDGHRYQLIIEFSRGNRTVEIIGAELYDMSGNYIGYWGAHNIPLKLQEGWRKHIKSVYGVGQSVGGCK